MSECKHGKFAVKTVVTALQRDKDSPIEGYMADIQINCIQCGIDFVFSGLPVGVSIKKPRVSIDGTEARLPISPRKRG